MYEVKDKVFLITGGAAGIGSGVVRTFLEEGAKHVAILDVDVTNGKALEAELKSKHGSNKVKFYKCDVTSKDLDDAFESVVNEFSYIDVVVNCAGILNDSPNVYVKQIEINVTALITSSLKAYNLMRKDRGGSGGAVVNVSSIGGIFQPSATPIYNATKSAVLQFSNCLGMEPHYSRSGVRFITLCFGVTDTSLFSSSKMAAIDKESDEVDLINDTAKSLPVQRPESAVKGLVEAYKRGASASTWLVTSNRPAEDITANIRKGYEIMSQGIFD